MEIIIALAGVAIIVAFYYNRKKSTEQSTDIASYKVETPAGTEAAIIVGASTQEVVVVADAVVPEAVVETAPAPTAKKPRATKPKAPAAKKAAPKKAAPKAVVKKPAARSVAKSKKV
jgi:hypothetical protein